MGTWSHGGWGRPDRGHPQPRREQFHHGVAESDRRATVVAAPPQHNPAQQWDVFVPGEFGAAVGAMAGRPNQRFLAGQAPGHHVEKTADAGTQQGTNQAQTGGIGHGAGWEGVGGTCLGSLILAGLP